jgi:hypothetical protein
MFAPLVGRNFTQSTTSLAPRDPVRELAKQAGIERKLPPPDDLDRFRQPVSGIDDPTSGEPYAPRNAGRGFARVPADVPSDAANPDLRDGHGDSHWLARPSSASPNGSSDRFASR